MNSIHTATVLGLTSGSSLDGVNAAVLTTDGVDVFEFGKTFDIPYDDNLREALRHMHKNYAAMDDARRRQAATAVRLRESMPEHEKSET